MTIETSCAGCGAPIRALEHVRHLRCRQCLMCLDIVVAPQGVHTQRNHDLVEIDHELAVRQHRLRRFDDSARFPYLILAAVEVGVAGLLYRPAEPITAVYAVLAMLVTAGAFHVRRLIAGFDRARRRAEIEREIDGYTDYRADVERRYD